MKISDFPIVEKLLQGATDSANANQKLQHRARFGPYDYVGALTHALDKLTAGLENGEIPNVRYVEAKQAVSYDVFSIAWGRYKKEHETVFLARHKSDVEYDIYYFHPQMNNVVNFSERFAKASDCEIYKLTAAFMDEIAPIAQAVMDLKSKTVKRQPKTEDEKKAERYAAPASTSKAVATVRTMLEKIVDDQYKELVELFYNRNSRYLKSFSEALKTAETDETLREPYMVRDGVVVQRAEYLTLAWHFTSGKDRPHKDRRVDGFATMIVGKAVELEHNDRSSRFIVKPDADQIMRKAAEEDAADIRNFFVAKNLRKIVSILEAKGDAVFDKAEIKDQSVDLRGLEGVLHFSFKDGSEFTVKNAVVFVVNSYGTQFYRFPLTFTSVKLPDGKSMTKPSEKLMNEVFVGTTA